MQSVSPCPVGKPPVATFSQPLQNTSYLVYGT